MDLLIKSAIIVDSLNPTLNGKKKDILIEKGIIKKIESKIQNSDVKTFEANNLHVSIGWFDMQADFCDPGYEYKEDLISGMKTAAKGGFTGVALLPSNNPPTDNKSSIKYIINNTQNNVVEVFPYGAISKGMKGEGLAEIYDMQLAGAVGFSDGEKSIEQENTLLQALLYTKDSGKTIITFPIKEKTKKAMVFESAVSMQLGLKGFPDILETINVIRDIYLAEYAESNIHIMPVCNTESIETIKQAKKRKVQITCGTSAAHLLLDDKKLNDFDSNYKLMPPLLDDKKRKALIKAVCNDSIDVICSNHTPQNKENKDLAFDRAEFGVINLQTAYAVANSALKDKISQEKLIEKLSTNPRKILGLDIPKIKEGGKANLTLFDPDMSWQFTRKENASQSDNSPFFDMELKGKPLAVINNNKMTVI